MKITRTIFGMFSLAAVIAVMTSPAAAQTYAITGAKIWTMAGAPIEGGTVVIKGGKITAVGKGVSVPSGAKVIDGKGLEVYPGFFDSVSEMGLIEIGQGASGTVDNREVGDFNPQLVAATAFHVESEHIPVARAAGVTTVVSAPGQGGGFGGGGTVIGGQASILDLNGWAAAEMTEKRSAALVLNWPTVNTGTFDITTFSFRRRPFTEVKQEYDRRVAELADLLESARHYTQAMEKGSKDKVERDLKLEALGPFVKGELPVLVIADDDRDIKNAVEFCEKNKLKMILGGGRKAYRVKELLKQKNIPVILRTPQALPSEEDEPYDINFTTPGVLHAAGVKVAMATFASGRAEVNSYNLTDQAGNTVAYGLPREEALKAITIYPAQMYGVSDKLGTIEAGKIANLVVTNGDALELKTQIRYVFIKGLQTSLDSKFKQLYEKYRARP